MAAAKPGSHSLQLRPVEVPKCMLNGEKFIRWDEDIGTVTPVTLRVDEHGFFLYWTDPYDEVTLLDISSVRDTRTGKSAKIPKDPKLRHLVAAQDSLEDKTLTVYYGSDFVNLSFISFFSTDTEIAKYWSEELIKMAYNLLQPNCAAVMCLKKAYAKLQLTKDKKSGKIPVKNIVRMFTQHKDDRKRVAKALDLAGFPHGKNDAINPQKFHFDNFFNFYKNLTCRSEVEKIFEKEIDNPKKKLMTADQLVDFLNKTQRDPRLNEILYPYANTERAKDLIKQYEPNKYNAQKGQLSFDGFLCYLMSEDNPLVSPAKLDLSENMDQPLSHYFINSSHNTYLTGHQLTGKSSVEIYRQCLLAGCRCVELDLWNGRNGDPVIVHGYTLVPEIPAKEVIEAIGESAFKTSEYPVILSFENHCNPRQQAKLAQYCREIFGDTLLDIPLESHPLEPGVLLPSPSLLKRKIIIKNKKKVNRKMSLESNGSFEYSGEVQGNGDIARPFLGEKDKENTEGEELIEENTIDPEEYIDVLKLEDKVVVVPSKDESEAGAEISALVNYIQPVHFASFEESEAKRMHFEMSSFDEKEATMLLKERPIDFVNYNKHQLSRVYPSGTRFDSSNFMPQIFWNAGCQLVALNYQTMDLGMQLNLGIFEYNGRCGYLLKPEFMRREDKSFDPFAESIVDGIIAGTVLVKVISGQCLTDKRVGTYVEVDMYGLPADTVRKKFRTKVVPGNGMNPVYEGEAFLFKKVVLPELACLRFTAYEESGRFIGHRVLPVVGLCPGYRHITLRNEIGQPLAMATLFLSIEVKDYVPKDFSEIAEALVNPIKFQNELDKRHAQLKMLTDEVCDTNDDPREKDSAVEEQFMKKPTSPEPVGPSVVDDKKETAPVTVEPSNATQEPSLTSRSSSVPARSSLIETAYQDIQAEPLDTFLECKEVKDKKMDLQKKLENLRKKHEKEKNNFCKVKVPKSSQEADKIKSLKFSVGHKLVKMSSSKNMHELPGSSGNVGRRLSCVTRSPSDDMMGQQAQEEKDLRLKYHEVVFNAASKSINSAQDTNLKVLKDEFEHKTSEVMDKLQVIRHNEIKALSKIHKDKDEMVRIKREVNTSMIEKGVKERLQLRKLYEKKKEELVGQYDEIRLQLEEEKMKSYELITKEYEQGKQLPSSNTAVDDSQMPSTSSGTAEDSQVPSVSSPATDDPQSPSSPNAAGDSAVQ